MTAIAFACLWCVVQVTLLSAVGIGMSLLATRRYPALAASATTMTMGVIFATTLLIPLRIPRWSLPIGQLVDPVTSQSHLIGHEAILAGDDERRKNLGGFSVDLYSLISQAVSIMGQKKRPRFTHHTLSSVVFRHS